VISLLRLKGKEKWCQKKKNKTKPKTKTNQTKKAKEKNLKELT